LHPTQEAMAAAKEEKEVEEEVVAKWKGRGGNECWR
jgi:hypothetical protein